MKSYLISSYNNCFVNHLHKLITLLILIFIPTCLLSQVYAQANIGLCEKPNILILLDRSGSMLDDDKWGQAQQALEEVFLQFTDSLRLGLAVFPWDDACDVPNSALKIPIGDFNAQLLQDVFVEALPERTALTPLTGAIQRGQRILTDLNDEQRKNILVLLTDGIETCVPEDQWTTAPVAATEQAFAAGYQVYTIGLGSLVNRTMLRNMAQAGGTDRDYSAEDFATLVTALTEIVESTTREECDLLDNDCDGLVDEGIMPLACDTQCGLGEILCVEGQLSECRPTMSVEEQCDGNDNDCDGYIDENLTFECELPAGLSGHIECGGGVTITECLPLPEDPITLGMPNDANDPNRLPEGCDGLDNDGDGYIDEGTEVPCDVGCHRGRRQCIDGNLLGCSAPPVSTEICNQYDDDCDGLVDEMNPCPGAERCGDVGLCEPPCSPDGTCETGFVCGADGYCESAPCERGCDIGFQCIRGECIYYCSVNTDCPSDMRCEDRKCVSTTRDPRNDSTGNGTTNTGSTPDTPTFCDPNDFTCNPANPEPVLTEDEDSETQGSSCQQQPAHSVYPYFILVMLLAIVRRKRMI
jgi:hypothetical protein